MTPTEKQRIEKEAITFAAKILGEPPLGMDDTIVTGYIAGATAEHDKARNQAIDEVKVWLKQYVESNYLVREARTKWSKLEVELESLKNNQLT